MRAFLLASFLFILAAAGVEAQDNAFVKIAPEPSYYAWWLRAQFNPSETQVRGIPVAKIRRTWCKATEFRKDLFPPELASDLDYTAEFGFSFSVDGFFDGSRIPQTALIGAYETCTGERGSFLLILARPPGRSPTIRFVHEMGIPFGILSASTDSTITVLHCLECDHSTEFKWNKSRRRYVRLPFRGP
jgi:hypothetical protein